jgi:hypothetical protein
MCPRGNIGLGQRQTRNPEPAIQQTAQSVLQFAPSGLIAASCFGV